MLELWTRTVRNCFADDHELVNRYECKDWLQSHEGLIARAIEGAGFEWADVRYSGAPRRRADGVVHHRDHGETLLRYELKSVFLPHYASAGAAHNHDYERLLRLEHPSGALSDVSRLRTASEDLRVFVLLAISWSDPSRPLALADYEAHRAAVVECFAALAALSAPIDQHELRGTSKEGYPWSADLRVWRVEGAGAAPGN
jgi:hypothetical protein